MAYRLQDPDVDIIFTYMPNNMDNIIQPSRLNHLNHINRCIFIGCIVLTDPGFQKGMGDTLWIGVFLALEYGTGD